VVLEGGIILVLSSNIVDITGKEEMSSFPVSQNKVLLFLVVDW